MGKRFHHELIFQEKAFSFYFVMGAVTALFILLGLSYRHDLNFLLDHYPLSVSFMAMNTYAFVVGRPHFRFLGLTFDIIPFLFAQYFFLLFMTVEINHTGAHYLSFLPILAAFYHVQSHWFSTRQDKLRQSKGIFAVVASSFWLPFAISSYKSTFSLVTSLSLLLGFMAWEFGTLFFIHYEGKKLWHFRFKGHLKNESQYAKEESSSYHPVLKDRYFFHDVINHTHGMNLLLGHRIQKRRGLTYEESLSLSTELQALQNLFQEHYGLVHKNLPPNWESVPFSFAKNMAFNLALSFLPEDRTEVFFLFTGALEESKNYDPKVPFVAFHRIFCNLVKNASEAHAKKVEITFHGEEDHMVLSVKNDFYRLEHTGYELGKNLAQVIALGDQQGSRREGLGLEAVENMSRDLGGDFSFSLKDGYWISVVHLPYLEKIELSETDSKSLKKDKKAA